MSTPNRYDLLGVAPDATADEIRCAWRAAIADLDPTDRRFAALNRAAEVLLDADRRTTYDAEIAPAPKRSPAPDPVVGAPRRAVPARLLVGVAVVTLLVAGTAAVVAATVPSHRAVQDASSEARAAAERAIVPVLSYDAQHLDRSRAAARGHLSGDYGKDYDRLFDGVIEQNAPSTGTVVYRNWVTVTMEQVDGDWLIAGMST